MLRSSAAACLLAATLVCWSLSRAAEPSILGLAVFALVVVVGALAWGEVVASLDRSEAAPTEWELPLTFAVGLLVLSALTLVGVLAWGRPAADLCAVSGLGTAILILRRVRSAGGPPFVTRTSGVGLLAVALALAATTLWLWPRFTVPAEAEGVLVYRFWRDAFVHAGWLGFFGGAGSPLALGHPEMTGTPLPLYHYGSYVVASAGARLGGLSGLEAVDALWTPLGFLLVPLVAFGAATRFAGRAAGLAALLGTTLVPDASAYGLKDPLLSVYWLEQVAPAACWGVAAAGVGLLFVLLGCRRGTPRAVALGWLFGLSTLLFKAQIAVAALPLLFAWPLLFGHRFDRRWRLRVAGVVVALAGLAWLLVARHPDAPTLSVGASGGERYVEWLVHEVPHPTVRARLSASIEGTASVAGLWCWFVPFLLVATFGGFLVIYAVVVGSRARGGRLAATDLLPAFVISLQLALSLGLAVNERGNPFELQHRTFVWSYLVVAAWSSGAVGAWLDRRWGDRRRALAAATLPLLLVPATGADGIRGARIGWAGKFVESRIPVGLAAAAGYLRGHAHRSDVVQDAPMDPYDLVFGLTGRRAYLARPERRLRRGVPAELVAERQEDVGGLLHAATPAALDSACGRARFDWLIVHPETRPAWEASVADLASFSSGGFLVYQRSRLCPPETRPAGRTVPGGASPRRSG